MAYGSLQEDGVPFTHKMAASLLRFIMLLLVTYSKLHIKKKEYYMHQLGKV